MNETEYFFYRFINYSRYVEKFGFFFIIRFLNGLHYLFLIM